MHSIPSNVEISKVESETNADCNAAAAVLFLQVTTISSVAAAEVSAAVAQGVPNSYIKIHRLLRQTPAPSIAIG